jgi:hypothetical protein
MTLEPSWRCAQYIQPVAGGDSCQVHHIGAVLPGKLHVQSDNWTVVDLGPGDAYVVESGRDAWVSRGEPCVRWDHPGDSESGPLLARSVSEIVQLESHRPTGSSLITRTSIAATTHPRISCPPATSAAPDDSHRRRE